MATTALERMVDMAWKLGCPRDQIENFRAANYVPQPKQFEFHAAARECDREDGPDEIGFGGARGPGKSHGAFAQLALDDCQRVPGLKALYLRKVGKQAREQFEDLRRTVLAHVAHEYKRHIGLVELWDNARIFIGSFKDERDVDNYLGIEYDTILIEEATSLSLVKYRALRDSNRTSKPDWRPRIYTTTNPGGVGHAWYKTKFVEPARKDTEQYTRFIFATVDDNVFVDSGYQRKLEENTGWRLRAYRYGDWDIAAGQFFTTWDYDTHVIEPFDWPIQWRHWLAMDYGFQHPTVIYLMAEDGDGNVYVIDEHREANWLPQRHVKAVEAMLARNGTHTNNIWRNVAGADVFAQRGDMSIADQYQAAGMRLTAASMDRINGAGEILSLLGDEDANITPRLFVFERCNELINCLPAMEHDPNRPEDVLKVDVDDDGNGGDDAYDALRYGVMAVKRKIVRAR